MASTGGGVLNSLLSAQAPLNVNTNTSTNTTAPSWYTDYLNNVAAGGQAAVGQGGVAGLGSLTQSAIDQAPGVTSQYQAPLSSAENINIPQTAGSYMSPYLTGALDYINNMGLRNINETLLPGSTAGAVAGGNFGSTANVTNNGQVISNALRDLTGQETAAANAAWTPALQGALTEQSNLGTLANDAGALGTQQLSTENSLGNVQQQQEQAKLNYPMQAVTNESALLKGYTVPTNVNQSYTGPLPNATYAPSNLQNLSTLLGGTAGAGANGSSASGLSALSSLGVGGINSLFNTNFPNLGAALSSLLSGSGGTQTTGLNPDGTVPNVTGNNTGVGTIAPIDMNNTQANPNVTGVDTTPGTTAPIDMNGTGM